MNRLDRLLEQYLIADVTETSLWTEGVFRALEQDFSCAHDASETIGEMTTGSTTEFP